MNKIKLN